MSQEQPIPFSVLKPSDNRTSQQAASRPALILFFILAFGLSWLFWLIPILAARGLFHLSSPFWFLVIGAFGPLVASFLVTCWKGGVTALLQFIGRGLRYQIGIQYLPVIFLLIPIVTALAYWLSTLSSGEQFSISASLQEILLTFAFLFFLGGSLQEEFGWAFAIDGLGRGRNRLAATSLLGVIWGVWHLPLFFIPGTAQSVMPFWIFCIATVAARILFVWIYSRTNQSILATLLFHTSFNLSLNLFPIIPRLQAGDQLPFLYLAILLALAAIGPAILLYRSREQ
jgi:hypothetical protein